MEPLDYARRENFQTVVYRTIESCKSTGYNPDDHFCNVTKMINQCKGTERPITPLRGLHSSLRKII
jgi:DNA-damage-inducible protein D